MVFLQPLADLLLTPLLGPLLSLPPLLAIFLVSLIISLVSVIIQKYGSDQNKLRTLRDKLKKLQARARSEKDPEKIMKINREIMVLQKPMMKEQLRPTLWTIIPFLLIFLWLNSHLAYLPLAPNEEFTVTAYSKSLDSITLRASPDLNINHPVAKVIDGKAVWHLSGDHGYYLLEFFSDNSSEPLASKNIMITNSHEFEYPDDRFQGEITRVVVGNEPLKPLGRFNIFGWRPGWIWVYIFFSFSLSLLFKKLFNVV